MSDHEIAQLNRIKRLQDELVAATMRADWALTEIGEYNDKLKAHEMAWRELAKDHPDLEVAKLMGAGKIPAKYLKGRK